MGYNRDLDKELWFDEIKDGDNVLRISIFSYNDGEKKLQIGPRTHEKKDGETSFRKAGRLSVYETGCLFDMMGKIIKVLEREEE